jgi:hypothetical protein
MSSVALDWDDRDDIGIQSLCAPHVAALQPFNPIPSGLSAASSISRAEESPSPLRHRPKLEPPKQHYMLGLLDLHTKVEGAASKELVLFKTQSQQDLAAIEKLEKEKNEALRKNAEETASRTPWSVLGQVSQYLASGASIVVGASMGGVGSLLVVSGVAGLGNRVIKDTVGWQSVASWFSKSVENQKQLVQRIEMGFLVVELGTGLAGGLGACVTGSYSALANTSRLNNARKMVGMIQTTSSFMNSTSKLGQDMVNKRISDLQTHMRRLDVHAEEIRMQMSREASSARNMIEMAESVGKEMHKAIAASEIHDL